MTHTWQAVLSALIARQDLSVVGPPDPLLVGRPELVYDQGEQPLRPHLTV